MALLASCEQNLEVAPQISTDKASYTLPQEGGEVTIKLLATQDWTATVLPGSSLDEVDGITVEPDHGTASSGVVEVVVKATANAGYDRKAILSFNGSTLAGAATVSQAGAEGERLLTCSVAEFLEKPVDASVYYVLTGKVTNSVNPDTYSNFHLQEIDDPSVSVLIYGLAYKEDVSNQKVGLLKAEGVEEGDIITIASTRGEYNGTIEGMYSYYISHEKSQDPMIKIGLTEVTAAKDTQFNLPVNSNLVTWTLTSDVDWLSFEPASSDKSETVVVTVSGEGEGDTGVITLSAEGLESQTCTVTRTDIKDVTVAEFLAEPVGDRPYRLTGKIGEIKGAEYGNFDLIDGTDTVYVYGLTATKVDKNDKSFASLGLREGDIVTIVGTRAEFREVAQVGGPAYLEKSVKSEDVTVSEFLTKEVASTYLESPYYRVSGIVKEVVSDVYGNLYLKEKDSETYVYMYGCTVAPVAKNDKTFAQIGIKAGDEITVVGQRGRYDNAKVEDQKDQIANGYIVSVVSGEPLDELKVENAKVTVDADATTASFAVKSNVAWSVAKTEGDWATLATESGENDGTITVNFEANSGEERVATFTVSAEGLATVELTLTQRAKEIVYNTLADITAEGSYIVKDAQVMAKVGKRWVLNDGTADSFVYGESEAKVGDLVTVEGAVVTYDGVFEWNAPTATVTGNKEVVYPTPAEYDEAAFTAYASAPKVEYIKVSATKAGNNVTCGSAKLYLQSVETLADGTYDIYGYTLGYSEKFGNTTILVVKAELKAVETVITASNKSVNVGETVELGATTNSTAALTYESKNPEIATVDAAGVVTGVAEGEATITISVAADGLYTAATKDVTVTVKATGEGGTETLLYTLDTTGSLQGSNNSYAGSCDVTVDDVTWNVTGNTQMNPWRIGGKNLTDVDRSVYTKTSYPLALTKVVLTLGTQNLTSINSCKLVYSINADFSDAKEIPFEYTQGAIELVEDFPANCYYKFVFNVTAPSSNKYLQFSKVEFYGLQ